MAITSTTHDSNISLITKIWLARAAFLPCEPRVPSLNTALKSPDNARHAGINPVMAIIATTATINKIIASTSKLTCHQNGFCSVAIYICSKTVLLNSKPQPAMSMAKKPPIVQIKILSSNICNIKRLRGTPKATRMATSLNLSFTRASNKLPTLIQASNKISNTTTAIVIKIE